MAPDSSETHIGSITVALSHGGEGHLDQLAADRIILSATVPSAPGSRISATFDDGTVVNFKVLGCRRNADGQFAITGRLFNLTRQQRLVLQQRLGPRNR